MKAGGAWAPQATEVDAVNRLGDRWPGLARDRASSEHLCSGTGQSILGMGTVLHLTRQLTAGGINVVSAGAPNCCHDAGVQQDLGKCLHPFSR